MTLKKSYDESITLILERISHQMPYDLVEKFSEFSHLTDQDIHPIQRKSAGIVCAIDGSNAIIAESGSFALAAIRAVQTTFSKGERHSRAITPLSVISVGPEEENEDFKILMSDCFGIFPETNLKNNDAEKVSEILRDTLEYWIALQQTKQLPKGSLLLLDGALRVTDQNHDPILQKIIQTAQDRGVLLAAITKRTHATWGGGHPLLPTVGGMARKFGMSGPWWVRINEHLLDSAVYKRGRQGDLYVASVHPSKNFPLKMELPKGTDEKTVELIMNSIVACSDDGRIPGYPYPLLDAHRTVVIDKTVMEQIRQDLMKGFSSHGLNKEIFDLLFGDIHDDFKRY
ncbi:DNA double-strand break repair nuclease NurA [Methanoregula sp.]|uniref:DNA double-strand break repair nuclease NurA n=1 Tax=Methanoregula sp. TaxID=2052170 RepID=UPI003564A594